MSTTKSYFISRPLVLLVWAALVASIMMVVLASPAHAATLTVNTTADEQTANNECSLREAIVNANDNQQTSTDCAAGSGSEADTIDFDLGSSATIALTPVAFGGLGSLPPIRDSAGLTIDGGSANITISGNNEVRVFNVGSGARLTLNKLTVANGVGLVPDDAPFGGGIYNSGGTLTVSNSTFSGNGAHFGGGIINSFGTATLKNTIVANSTAGGNCFGTITDGGYNLSSDNTCVSAATSLANTNPQLGSLADNGSPTKTHALLEGSPAIDQGNSFGVTTDQRGLPRPSNFFDIPNATGGDGSDIGAFELQAPPDTTPPSVSCSVSPSTLRLPANNHKLVAVTASVQVTDSGGSGPDGFKLLSVTSNQADSGLGRDDVPNDIQGWTTGTPDTSGQLRAERYRTDRVYTLTYQGIDKAGNTKNCQATVRVRKGG
jgi:CSLREA domain-containing protein